MKKNLILPECEWVLTDEAKKDSRLNPTDKNVLAVLQYMFDSKSPLDDGFYAIVLREANNATYTLEGTLKSFGFKVDETTIGRSINKLCRFGYLDYRRGFYNANTNSGQPPKIRILKGTVSINNCTTDSCGVIADTKDISGMNDEKLSTGLSDSYSVIADTKNKEQEKEQIQEQVTYSYSDIGQGEDTTFVGEGDGVVDIKALLDSNVCNEKVMGDLLEWTIQNGWFVTDVQVDRVVDATMAKCGFMQFNRQRYKDIFNALQEQADWDRIHNWK